jgi:hypothetical protein
LSAVWCAQLEGRRGLSCYYRARDLRQARARRGNVQAVTAEHTTDRLCFIAALRMCCQRRLVAGRLTRSAPPLNAHDRDSQLLISCLNFSRQQEPPHFATPDALRGAPISSPFDSSLVAAGSAIFSDHENEHGELCHICVRHLVLMVRLRARLGPLRALWHRSVEDHRLTSRRSSSPVMRRATTIGKAMTTTGRPGICSASLARRRSSDTHLVRESFGAATASARR